LLGALNHLAVVVDSGNPSRDVWVPVPFDAGPNIANILQVVLTGHLEENKVMRGGCLKSYSNGKP